MENSNEENFLRIRYEEQGKTCENKILQFPKNYEFLMKLLNENFDFTDEGNYAYIVSFKDLEGDYLDISNSLDYDQALKCFQNSNKNYLKIKITKKDRNAKESRVNNEFDFLNYDSYLHMRKNANNDNNVNNAFDNLNDISNFLENSNFNSNLRSIAIESSKKKGFFGDQVISRIDASFQKLENKFSGEPGVNYNNDLTRKIIDKLSKKENGEVFKGKSILNDDNNLNSESLNINCISRSEREKFFNSGFDKNNIDNITCNQNQNEKLICENKKYKEEVEYNNLPLPVDQYQKIKAAKTENNINNYTNSKSENFIVQDNIISNEQVNLRGEYNNDNKLKHEKIINENNDKSINREKRTLKSNTHNLYLIEDETITSFLNEKLEPIPNYVYSARGFNNNQNLISENHREQNKADINKHSKNNELNHKEEQQPKFTINDDSIQDKVYTEEIKNPNDLFSPNNKIGIEEINKEDKLNNKVKYFQIIKSPKKNKKSVDKNDSQNSDYIEDKPAVYLSSKSLAQGINDKKESNKQIKKEKKKNKQVNQNLESTDMNIFLFEEKLKNLSLKDNELGNLVCEKTKKGFEKLLIKKINKMIDKEFKFTQEIIFRKSKSLIKEFLKDFEFLVKKQLELNTNSDKTKASEFANSNLTNLKTKEESYENNNNHKNNKNTNYGTRCKKCAENIKNIRFTCSVCPCFDLCEKCEANLNISEHDHDFIKIRNADRAVKRINSPISVSKSNSKDRDYKALSEKRVIEDNNIERKNNKYNFNANHLNKVKFYSNNNFENNNKINLEEEKKHL